MERVSTFSPRPQSTDTAGTGDTVYIPPPCYGELWELEAVYWLPEVDVTAHGTNYATYEAHGSDGSTEIANFDGDTPTTDDLSEGVPQALTITGSGTDLEFEPSSRGVKCTVTKVASGVATTGQFGAVWRHVRDVN